MKNKCPKCRSNEITKQGFRKNKSGKKQKYRCEKCKKRFVADDGFKRMRHKKEDVVRAIHLHNEGLSLFQVKDHLWQHDGIKISRESVREWCNKYSVFLKSDK